MRNCLWKKGLILGIILLFVVIAVQPGIIADDSFESDNSELVEITIEICKGNGAYDHTVMLSQKQAEELESIISTTKTKLDAAETLEETSAIFNDTVVSLYELGVLPEGMSIEDAKNLVNGLEQETRFFKKLERWFSRNQEKRETFENFLCLMAGHTDRTFFIGPLLIPSIILVLIIGTPLVLLDYLLFKLFDIRIVDASVLFQLLLAFGGLNILTWQINPLAFGHLILLGAEGMWGWQIPAVGWIYTIGLNGIKSWNSFYGWILGFTGLKICLPSREVWTQFYMGAAITVNDNF